MIKEQENLVDGILNYLEIESSGALMVTGPWGCGKSYFFEHFLFEKLKAKNFKPLRVSLFGLSSLSDLSKNVVCEYAQYLTDNKKWEKIVGGMVRLIKGMRMIKVPVVSDYIDLKGIFGEGKALYKLLSDDVVVCLDDLERAIEKYDINDLLGVINELVENQHLKVIVIANKEYIDKQQWSRNDSAASSHDVFYEKVIEKVLHFTPDIVGVFETLNHSDGKEESDAFEKFMNKECIKNSVSPKLANSVSLQHQKENIRTLKFAVSHFRSIFQNYINHGKDVTDVKIERLLINQWLFLYSLSLESKQTTLSVDDSMGLDKYVATASMEQLDLDFDNSNSFEEYGEQKNKEKSQDIAKKFVETYYQGRENEYNFYPYLYHFVVAGLNYDFDEAFEFAEKACQRFDYTVNPAQEIMDKWMKGYWKMSDGEAKVNLLKLKDYVAEGKLQDFPSYYSASVFLFKFCEIIDTTILKLLPLFEQGLRKFADNVEVNIAHLSVIKAIGVNKDDVCKPVYDLIIKVMEDKIEKQKNAEVNHMRELFNKDMQAFCELFIPHDQSSPKFIITPVLHLLDEKDIEKKITVATPEDIISLYLLVVFRFNSNDKLFHVAEEMPFIERLEKYAILRAEDKKKLSSVIINDQLLPLLKKVKNKYN